jgi:N6-adenosine-specific RNA methylase IME4
MDIPWKYYGSPTKDQAAGKHYDCLTDAEIFDLPVQEVLLPKSILFLWATGPKLDVALHALSCWGLWYRGIAFDWVKTTNAGNPINGQGGRPSLIKHAGELVLWASPQAKGRPLPIKDEGMASWIFENVQDYVFESRPGNVHSRKPETVQDRIEALIDAPYPWLELFGRRKRENWEVFGNQIEGEDDT